MKTYAGIGARSTPKDVLELMVEISSQLGELGWTLHSGGADGADSAFEHGAKEKQIFLPWKGYNFNEVGVVLDNLKAWDEVSKHFHAAPEKCSIAVQRLHGRNAYILLGDSLDKPVDMVICWTPRGEITGGTGLALRIAKYCEIPVFNLAKEGAVDSLVSFVNNQ